MSESLWRRIGILAAVVAVAVGIVVLAPRGGVETAGERSESSGPTAAPAVLVEQPADSAGSPLAAAPTGSSAAAIADDAADADLPYPGADEPALWEEELDALLAESGGDVLALYARLLPDHRHNLIDLLYVREDLQPHLRRMMAVEEDSDLRELLVLRIVPSGLDDLDFAGDPDVADLLEQPTRTPIESGEWQARLTLAALVDEELCLRLCRQSADLFPGDPAVTVLANAQLLILAAGRDDIGGSERAHAARELERALAPNGPAASLPGPERIRGYTALVFGPDAEAARRLLRDVLAVETDPDVRRAIDGLLRSLP
ncbi:MAG: hypothetical protein KF858_09435 [Candidatus Sumerlaeia bacterium]|nr:hypothetical protein [Candidatus Sumerlaeia bacterium]